MDYLVSKGYTQRLACRVVGLSRSSYCRRRAMANQPSQPDKYAALRVWLVKFADEHHRWGYRRAWQCARAEGWNVGRETVRRLWRAENLRVQPRRKGKRLKATISEAYWVLFRFLYGGQLGCPVLIVAGDDLLRGGISQGLVEALVVPPVDPVQGCPFDFGT